MPYNKEKAYREIENGGAVAKPISANTWLVVQELVEKAQPKSAWYDSPKYRCPRCDEDLTNFKGRQGMFCLQCGQCIDWVNK